MSLSISVVDLDYQRREYLMTTNSFIFTFIYNVVLSLISKDSVSLIITQDINYHINRS